MCQYNVSMYISMNSEICTQNKYIDNISTLCMCAVYHDHIET